MLSALLGPSSGGVADLSSRFARAAQAIAEHLLGHLPGFGRCGFDNLSRPAQRTAQDPHPIHQYTAVRRVVDVALHDRPIGPQLAPASHFQPVGQDDDMFKQAVQRLWLNQVGPLDERRVIRHRVQVNSAKLP